MIDLNTCVVLQSDGTVSLAATLTSVSEAVAAFNTTHLLASEAIGTAVHAVFEQYKGVNINMAALAANVAQKLGTVSLSDYAAMSASVKEYVHNHPLEFVSTKGRGGGTRRISDTVPATV
jgi:hypothetical protein